MQLAHGESKLEPKRKVNQDAQKGKKKTGEAASPLTMLTRTWARCLSDFWNNVVSFLSPSHFPAWHGSADSFRQTDRAQGIFLILKRRRRHFPSTVTAALNPSQNHFSHLLAP